jgi:glycine cleavage system H protein
MPQPASGTGMAVLRAAAICARIGTLFHIAICWEKTMSIRQDRRYGRTHEWYTLEDGVVTVGVTEQGQEMLGDVVFADLPDIGQTVSEDAPCATLESVKAASDVLCPVDGEVIEVNPALEDSPELINDDPLDAGWILRIRASGEPAEWMDPGEYERMLQGAD